MSLYSNLKEQLNKKGISIINGDYYNQIDLWKEYYSGDVNDFHHYNIKLADGTNTQVERLTMNMPKKVVEDIQKLLWSDKAEITLDDDEKTLQLWEILESRENNFNVMFPKIIELAAAFGTTAMTEFIDNNGKVNIEYILDAKEIIPYSYSNSIINGFVVFNRFVQEERRRNIYYTHLTYHEYKDGNYTKYHELYRSVNETELGKEIEFNKMFPNVQESITYENVEVPHFQIFSLPIVNNYDITTPMGISIFANSLDRFKSIDTKYDDFANEYDLSKKRILIDQTALKATPNIEENGKITMRSYFDKNDRAFMAIRGMEEQPIKEIDFSIREKEYEDGINVDLSWLGSNLGLGEDFYTMGHDGLVTATQILSEDSDAYRTKCSYELVLKQVLRDMVKAICYLAGIESKTVNIITDYSRFKNEAAEQQRLEREVDKGIISKVEYRMKIYDEDEEEARAKIAEIEQNSTSISDLLGEQTSVINE